MFRHLRIKLTVLYTALYCGALLLSSLTAYTVISTNAQNVVSEQLQSTSAVFDRLWQIRFGQLEAGAALSARDYGFRQAVATNDTATMRSALQNLRRRLGADLVYLVTPDGRGVNADESVPAEVSRNLQDALANDDVSAGVMTVHGAVHQAVTAPIYAPNLLGWIVVAQRLDQREMRALEHLSAIPLHATALTQTGGGWRSADDGLADRDDRAIDAFVAHAIRARGLTPGRIDMGGGAAIALVKPLHGLDGTRGALLVRYPLAAAMAPYRDLFGGLAAIAILGLALLVFATWVLANSITKPVSALGEAAQQLQAGEAVSVPVRGRDEIALLASSFNLMASAIKERERRITDLAFTDSETGLPNRRALQRRLEGVIDACNERRLYVAAVGIDRFPQIRGAIGYDLASSLIGGVGAQISKLAPKAPLGRVASDTIGIAFVAANDDAALERALRLQAHIERPIQINGQSIDIEATIGLAHATAGVETPAIIIARANVALDQARAARVKTAIFDQDTYGDPAANLSLMGEMRRALASGDIQLAFQPKLDFRTRTIDSAEALVRWRHPQRGDIAPDLFVPMAEQTGHIRALTDWVLAKAVDASALLASAGWPIAISVNVSGRVLGDRDFARHALQLVGREARGLCFEITETAVIDNPTAALENIDLFAANGVRISIDDYGSGLSSLAYLKQIKAHELKIDKVFIQNLARTQRDALLVRSTIDLAHSLGLKVTAEGIEDESTFALLAAMGCDAAQGYFVSKPLVLNDLLTVLNDPGRMHASKTSTLLVERGRVAPT